MVREFIVYNPQHQMFTITNLAQFCEEHNLNQGNMSSVANGRYKQHKGWTAAGGVSLHS